MYLTKTVFIERPDAFVHAILCLPTKHPQMHSVFSLTVDCELAG